VPVSAYNKLYGGKRGSAAKAKAAMQDEYGPQKGERVFYGHNANLRRRKRRRKG
jgi:hypothetical protein